MGNIKYQSPCEMVKNQAIAFYKNNESAFGEVPESKLPYDLKKGFFREFRPNEGHGTYLNRCTYNNGVLKFAISWKCDKYVLYKII